MPENILGVSVTPTIPTSDGQFYFHSDQPDPSPDFASIQQQCNQAAGTSVDPTLLKAQFQLFMGQYNPFVSNAIYTSTTGGTPDTSPDSSSQTTSVSPYYDKLFVTSFTTWAQQFDQRSTLNSSNQATQQQNLQAFSTFLATSPLAQDVRQKQKNVMIWQFTYILTLMFKLQNTVRAQGNDPGKFQAGMEVAQRRAQATTIPQLQQSSVSNQVADPDSVQKQSDAQIALEAYRQGFNACSDRERQSESDLSFSQDAISQTNNANTNFWQTMSKLLKEVQNI